MSLILSHFTFPSCLRGLLYAALAVSTSPLLTAVEPAVLKNEPARAPVWEAPLGDFSESRYVEAVEELFSNYEKKTKQLLTPGAKHRVGLKIYADSGPGLSTPAALVRAVSAALERRGYAAGDIFLVGLNPLRLRMTGFLPSFSSGQSPFPGHPVYVLESGKFYDPGWFYDSPLPARFDPIVNDRAVETAAAGKNTTTTEEDRKSYLATPLFLEADFWINLPVYTDHPVLGVNGALVNATLWNASNTYRFFKSPATAPAAVAEMSAIPELREGWRFTITSLQLYQFIGGPYFNSLYTKSEPLLWMSEDPVVLDALMLERFNLARKHTGFEPINDDGTRLLSFAEQLGVGSSDVTEVPWRRLPLVEPSR